MEINFFSKPLKTYSLFNILSYSNKDFISKNLKKIKNNKIFKNLFEVERRYYNYPSQLIAKFVGHKKTITSLCFSPNDDYIYSGGLDMLLCSYSLEKLNKNDNGCEILSSNSINDLLINETSYSKFTTINCVTIDRSGNFLAVNSFNKITKKISNVELFEIVAIDSLKSILTIVVDTLKTTNTVYYSLNFSPCGNYLAISDSTQITSIYWVNPNDINFGKLKLGIKGHTADVSANSISSNGKYIATGGYDNLIFIFEVENDYASVKNLKKIESHKMVVSSLAYSPDSNYLASAGWDLNVFIYGANPNHYNFGKVINKLMNHTNAVSSISFSYRGNLLASGGFDGKVNIYNIANIENVRRVHYFEGDFGNVFCVKFSNNENRLAIAGTKSVVCLYK